MENAPQAIGERPPPPRQSRWLLWGMIGIAALGLWGLLAARPGRDQQPASPSESSAALSTEPTASGAPGTFSPTGGDAGSAVRRAIDGDTIELESGETVRYIGVDTPESVHPKKPIECFGVEAAQKNAALVEGKAVRLERDVSERDRYGRLLRYVYVGDTFVNEELVRQGFAHALTYPPDVRYQDRFREAERDARAAGRGLWSGCARQPAVLSGSAPPAELSASSPPLDGSGACQVKGNIAASGEKIYHVPGCGSYEKTMIDAARGERTFCSESDALAAGWRKARNCP